MPYRTLNQWRFDDPNWAGNPFQAPLLYFNVEQVESWSGYALSFSGLEPAWLAFPLVDDAGQLNLDANAGAVQTWFSPYWSSEAAGGKGPGHSAVLFVAGSWSGQSAAGWWLLEVDPEGNSVALMAVGPVESLEVLRAPLAWQAGAWHQITLNYSAKGTELYLDGALAAVGPGVELSPLSPSPGRDGFALGSAALGNHSALGEFDELTTYIEPRRAEDIAAHYHMLKGQAALGPISPAEEAQLQAKIQALAAASFGVMAQGQEMSFNCGNGPVLTATLLADNTVRLDFFCRDEGVTYELAYAPSLTKPIHWQRVAFIPPEQADYIISDANVPQEIGAYPRSGFYRFGKLPDYYVWATAAPNGDGSRDLPFRTLQAALDQAPDGTVINVLPGVYSGAGNYNLSFGNKNLVLVSERGWEQTTIDCGAVAGSRAFTFNTAIAAKVIGFTIANALDSAVYCGGGSHPMFINCSFTGNIAALGGAVRANDATVALINCRFRNNRATSLGGAIYAQLTQQVPHYWVYITHCTFSDNPRPSGAGTIYAADNSSVEIDNSILWTALNPDPGVEIVTAALGSVVAQYCDIRGVVYPGEGNLSDNPLFETGNTTLRLTSTSPCIDQGKPTVLLGESWATRYDMDGEARLDHAFANAYPHSTTDIGADEYVYRLQFPLDGAFSQVDEASGVAYLGTITAGSEQHAKFAVIDDEVTTLLYIYELNAAGSQIIGTTAVSIKHPTPPGVSGVSNDDITDLEDITFDPDPARRHLYIATSLTKRNRYRDVDHLPDSDPLVDPPSSDYDRRRTIVMRLHLDGSFNPLPSEIAPTRDVWESENAVVPDRGFAPGTLYNTGYNANVGLIAYIRNQLDYANSRYRQLTIGNGVLIAWNTVDKFGTPVNGVTYTGGQQLPYDGGGPSALAGTVLGNYSASGSTTHPGLQASLSYYYRIWAFDANHNYYPLSMRGTAVNIGIPMIMINEFEVDGGTERVELYNPAPVAVNISGFGLSNDPALPFRWTVPATTSIPGRGFYLDDSFHSPGIFSFAESGDDNMYLTMPSPTRRLDEWNMKDPDDLDSEGRAWDGGPRGATTPPIPIPGSGSFGSCRFFALTSPTPPSPFPPTFSPTPTPNDTTPRRTFDVVPAVPAIGQQPSAIHLVWANVGLVPAAWAYTPKQHDNHSINLEGFAYRSQTEMIVGLRSPLSGGATESTPYFSHQNRVRGKALYFRVNDVGQFLPTVPAVGWTGVAQGIAGPFELDLRGQGIRCIQWCPQLAGGAGRYLIIGGPANGGPLEKELFGEKFTLYSWTGVGTDAAQVLVSDLRHYTIRPEGVNLIVVDGATRVLFVEDRFKATGYATRNAVHWPLSILGTVQ